MLYLVLPCPDWITLLDYWNWASTARHIAESSYHTKVKQCQCGISMLDMTISDRYRAKTGTSLLYHDTAPLSFTTTVFRAHTIINRHRKIPLIYVVRITDLTHTHARMRLTIMLNGEVDAFIPYQSHYDYYIS